MNIVSLRYHINQCKSSDAMIWLLKMVVDWRLPMFRSLTPWCKRWINRRKTKAENGSDSATKSCVNQIGCLRMVHLFVGRCSDLCPIRGNSELEYRWPLASIAIPTARSLMLWYIPSWPPRSTSRHIVWNSSSHVVDLIPLRCRTCKERALPYCSLSLGFPQYVSKNETK